ncbi:transposase, partial [mine drainage metagenome]
KASHFGYKLHTIQDAGNDMILNYATTTASVHDSQIDLGIPGIVNYKDRGYFGNRWKRDRRNHGQGCQ